MKSSKDLRVPVAWALNETYGDSTSDDELVEMAVVMTPFTAVAATTPAASRSGASQR